MADPAKLFSQPESEWDVVDVGDEAGDVGITPSTTPGDVSGFMRSERSPASPSVSGDDRSLEPFKIGGASRTPDTLSAEQPVQPNFGADSSRQIEPTDSNVRGKVDGFLQGAQALNDEFKTQRTERQGWEVESVGDLPGDSQPQGNGTAGGDWDVVAVDSGFGDVLAEGAKDTMQHLRGAATLAGLEDEQDYLASYLDRQRSRTPISRGEQKLYETLASEWEDVGEESSWWGKTLEVGDMIAKGTVAAATDPKATADLVVRNLPNMLPSVGVGATGAIAGGAVGGPVGAIVGGLLGMTSGTLAIESGAKLFEKLQERSPELNENELREALNDERFIDEVQREGLTKGGTIAAIDALSFGILGKTMTGPGRALYSGVSNALRKHGVDPTNVAQVKRAVTDPDIQAALKPHVEQYRKATSMPARAKRGTAGVGIETAGEATGELFGERAASGEWQGDEAFLEAIAGFGTALGQAGLAAGTVGRQRKGQADRLAESIEQAPTTSRRTRSSERPAAPSTANQGMERPAIKVEEMPVESITTEGGAVQDFRSVPVDEEVDLYAYGDQGTPAAARDTKPEQITMEGGAEGPTTEGIDVVEIEDITMRDGRPFPTEKAARLRARNVENVKPVNVGNGWILRSTPSTRTMEAKSESPDDIVMRDGKPFPTNKAAQLKARRMEGVEPVQVDKGWALRRLPTRTTEAKPETVESTEQLTQAANEAATSPENDLPEPSQAQKSAGNYRKGRVRLNGMEISVENPKGSTRSGTNRQGENWSVTMKDHYGYLKKSEGSDGEQVDVFLTDQAHREDRPVFVVDQVDPETGRYDEAKVILGAKDESQARHVYQRNYARGWQGLGAITRMSQDEFKEWTKGDTTKPVALKRKAAGPEARKGEESEAPAQAAQEHERGVQGRTETVYTPDNQPVQVQYEVIEVDRLIPSHTADGRVNPDFPVDRQPRQRERAASQAQIQRITGNLNPALLEQSPTTDTGAPIVDENNIVESGNGRVAAIQLAARQGNTRALKDHIIENADRFGLDPDQVRGMDNPVLVRRRLTKMGEAEQKEFARSSNRATAARLSPTEQAEADAQRLTDEDLALFDPGEDGNVLARSNRPFVKRFLELVGDTEAAALVDPQGNPNRGAVARIQGAIFQRAYGDRSLVQLAAEDADLDIQNILTALQKAAPAFARARSINAGEAERITGPLIQGIQLVRQAKQARQNVDEYLNQQGLFEDSIPTEAASIASFIGGNTRSARRMGIAFTRMGELLEAELIRSQNVNLFEGVDITSQEIIDDAIQTATEGRQQEQSSLFAERQARPQSARNRGQRSQQGRQRERAQTETDETVSEVGEGYGNTGTLQATRRQGSQRKVREPTDDETRQQPLFDTEGLSQRQAREQLRQNFLVRYEQVPVGTLQAGTDTVTTAEEVAHVVAPIRKHAQETFVAVVTDRRGQIRNVIRHTKGGRDSSMVDPSIVAPAIAATEGAAGVWFVHHHPSGDPKPSDNDRRLTGTLQKALDGTGIDFKGQLVIGRGGSAWVFDEESGRDEPIQITPMVRKRTVPITERIIRKQPQGERPRVESPDAAAAVARDIGAENAVVLLDTKHQVAGHVVLSVSEMKRLRSGNRVRRMMAAIDATNPSAALIVSENRDAARNMAKFLHNVGEIQVLDALIREDGELTSSMETGAGIESARGKFYSRQPEGSRPGGMTVETAYNALASILGKKATRNLLASNDFEIVQQQTEIPGVGPVSEVGVVNGRFIPSRDKTYLVADSLTKDNLWGVFLHEVGAHYGLPRMIGRGEYEKVKRQLQNLHRIGNKRVMAARRRVPANTPSEYIWDETLAYLVENPDNHDMSLVRRVIAMVRAFLKRMGFLRAEKLAIDDIVELVKGAARREARMAPNTPIQAAEQATGLARVNTRTENFQRWFGDSRLVDAEGDPLVLYHGTKDNIETFNLDHPNRKDTGWLGRGVYLTDQPGIADTYAGMKEGAAAENVMPVFARIEKPYYATREEKNRLQVISQEQGREAGLRAAEAFTDRLQTQGYDGVILEYESPQAMEVVVFDPAGVKSAVGNRGTFDPRDPSILHSRESDRARIRRVLQDRLPNKGTAQSYSRKVRELVKEGAFTQDQLEASGLMDRLQQFKRTPSQSERLDESVLDIPAKRSKIIQKDQVLGFLDEGLYSRRRVSRDKLREMGMDFENLPGDDEGNPTRPTTPVEEEPEAMDSDTARGNLKDQGFERPEDDDGLFSVTGTPEQGDLEQAAETAPRKRGIYQRRAQNLWKRIDDKIGWYTELGDLPAKERYLKERYLALGKVAEVEDVGRRVYDTFAKADADDQVAVYNYLTTRGADPTEIQAETVRQAAVETKEKIDEIGRALVDRGILKHEQYEQHKDQYLPRLYLRHLLDDKARMALGNGQKPSDMGYIKSRKDIPKDVREAVLGEITDPAFLAGTAMMRTGRDIAILDFLGEVARDKDWVFAPSIVKLPSGKRVSVFHLQSERDNITRQMPYYTPEVREKAERIVRKIDQFLQPKLEEMGKVPDEYRQVPNTVRYGNLRGMWVRKEVYEDIMGTGAIANADPSFAEYLFGYGGIGTKVTQLWKMSKVALNPPTQVRNFVSNGVLLHLSGVPFVKVPVMVKRAISEIRNNGKHWQIAKKHGVTQSTFAAQELYRIRRDILDLESRLKGRWTFAHLKNIGGIIADRASDLYQLSEAIFKTAKIIHAMESQGMSESEAVMEAQKWLYDYSLVPKSVGYFRNAPVGVPFITFYYKTLPRMLEVAITAPWRFTPYLAIPMALAAWIASDYDVDEDDVERLKEALPEWLRDRGHAYIMPVKDSNGRWQPVNFGYFFPWVMFTETARHAASGRMGEAVQETGIFGGPIPDLITAMKTGKDPFTGRDIYNRADPPARQMADIMNYVYTMAAPTWLTDRGFAGHMYRSLFTENIDRYGRERLTPAQSAARLVGVNVYPIKPMESRARNIRYMRFAITEIKRRRGTVLKDRSLSREVRLAQMKKFNQMIREKQEEFRDYIKRSRVHPNLR